MEPSLTRVVVGTEGSNLSFTFSMNVCFCRQGSKACGEYIVPEVPSWMIGPHSCQHTGQPASELPLTPRVLADTQLLILCWSAGGSA